MKKNEVMSSVSQVISFIKERAEVDLKEALNRKMFNVEKSEIDKICKILQSSIDASFFKASDQIESKL